MFDNDKRKKLRVSVLAAALAALPFAGYAAGLGKLTVLSALGQPLRAELDIAASKEELSSLTARIAPQESFRQANIEYAGILSNVRLSLDRRSNGQPYFRVSSDRIISDPFLDMLIELSWSSGRLVREYTFLLDPPELNKPVETPAPVNAPVAAAPAKREAEKPAPAPAAEKPVQAEKSGEAPRAESLPSDKADKQQVKRSPRVAAAPAPAAPAPDTKKLEKADKGGETRTVRKGETLAKIAAETKPEGASLDQMLVALFRSNQEAFEGGNMNRLKAGKILSVPDAEAVKSVESGEAHKVVTAQSSDFEAYKRKLAGSVAAAPAAKEAAPQQAAGGKIAPKVEDKVPAPSGKDKLQVSRTETAGDAGKLKALEEDKIAKEKALKEAQSRIAELEKNMAEMRKLVELKNQAAADLQKQAAKPAPAADKKPEPAPAAKPADAPKVADAAKAVEATKPAEPPKEQAKPAEPAKAPEAEKPAIAEEKPAAPPPKPKKPVVIPEPEPEPSFIEENLPLVAGGGGVLALLLGYFGFKSVKRRKAAKEASAADSVLSSSSVLDLSSSEAFSQVEGQPSEFGEIGATGFGAGEGVDPIREAETFMAYGRDAQAEEILVDALRKDAGNLPVYLKLLEIYAARKSVFQFNAVAHNLYDQTSGQGAEWDKAAELGRVVDPDNALYQGQAAEAPEVAAEEPRVASEATEAAVPQPEPEAEVASAEPAADQVMELDFDLDLGASSAAEAADAAPVEPAPEAVEAPAAEPEALEFAAATPSEESTSAEAPPAAAEEVASLDFDLDLGATPAEAPVSAAEPVAPVAEAAAADAGFDIDFDLGTPTEPAAVEPVQETAVAAAADDGNMLDFDLNQGAQAAAAVSEVAEAPALETAAALDLDFDLTGAGETAATALPDLPVDAAAPEVAAAADAPLDFDFDLGEAPSIDLSLTESPAAPPLDLSGISLDLSEPAAPEAPAVSEAPVAEPENPEVATKLELAQAYEEMGDREGAKELFQEVLAEGNSAQQAIARDKLAVLA